MCFSRPKTPDPSIEMRREEDERQQRIRDTSAEVNRTFDERFGPNYYQGLGDAFRAYYRPQIDEKFADAKRATVFRYADNADSSAANKRGAELQRDYGRAFTDLESGAFDTVNKAKQDVEAKRANLLALAEGGAGMENTAAIARGAASADIGRSGYSPLGDLFSKYTSNLASAAQRSDAGMPVNPFYGRQVDFLRGNSSGSQKVIGGGS